MQDDQHVRQEEQQEDDLIMMAVTWYYTKYSDSVKVAAGPG